MLLRKRGREQRPSLTRAPSPQAPRPCLSAPMPLHVRRKVPRRAFGPVRDDISFLSFLSFLCCLAALLASQRPKNAKWELAAMKKSKGTDRNKLVRDARKA